MDVLITGGSGFLGRHFQKALEERGDIVDICDLIGPTSEDVRTDLRKYTPADYNLVIHLAGVVGGRRKIEGQPLAIAQNFEIDSVLFRWATGLFSHPGRIVYVSSSAVYPTYLQATHEQQDVDPYLYPNGEHVKLSEDMLTLEHLIGVPDQTYGWAKLIGEVLAQHARDADVPVTIIRPFSGYGSDQESTYPFGAFMSRAMHRDDPFIIWGDGNQVRDFVHVDDIVGATLRMVDEDIDGPVNIGNGRATTFNELAQLVTSIAGYQPEFRRMPQAPTGVQYRVADTTLLDTIWPDRITLEDGVARAFLERK